MKRILLFIFPMLIGLPVLAQSKHQVVLDANAVPRILGSFSAIEVSGSFNLYLSQGNEEGVAVSAVSPELLGRIKTEVSNGVLKITFEGKGLGWKGWQDLELKAYVSLKSIHTIKASGACNVKVVGELQAQNLSIDMSGASDFKGKLTVQQLEAEASGASNLQLTGTAQDLKLETSGASNVKAFGLMGTHIKIHSTGASHIQISAEKSLDVNASGASRVSFKGDPSPLSKKISGASSVKKMISE